MKTYQVLLVLSTDDEYTVEADNEDEAVDEAIRRMESEYDCGWGSDIDVFSVECIDEGEDE